MLDGMRYDDDPSGGVIDGQTFRQPAMRIKFTAPAGYTIANAADAVTVQGARGQAQLSATGASTDLAGAVAARFQALGGQIDRSRIRATTIGGRSAAAATITATTGNTQVDATVMAIGFPNATYVWTIVTPAGSGIGPFDPLLASFTSMTAAEAAAIRGKRLRVVAVKAGDTIDTLARRMAYPDFQRDRFLTLNGLAADATLRPGTLVKLVTAE